MRAGERDTTRGTGRDRRPEAGKAAANNDKELKQDIWGRMGVMETRQDGARDEFLTQYKTG